MTYFLKSTPAARRRAQRALDSFSARLLLVVALFSIMAIATIPPVALAAPTSPAWRLSAQTGESADSMNLKLCARDAHAQVVFHLPDFDTAANARPERDGAGDFAGGDGVWRAGSWGAGECAHFTVDLDRAAAGGRGARRGSVPNAVRLLPPQRWLWLPDSLGAESTIAFDVPAGHSASVPWRRVDSTSGRPTYALGSDPLDGPALTVFGPFEDRVVRRPGGVLRVAVIAPRDSALAERLFAWIGGVADVALTANGKLPLGDSQVLVIPIPGSASPTPWGEVQRGGGSALHLYAGAEASTAALRSDWTATHEISHLFHPYLGTRGRWLGEGLASYYQNVLRSRAGWMAVGAGVTGLRDGFMRGERESSTRGISLEQASRQMHDRGAYMRVYWAGAAYWLTVDARLRREHDTSLDDVLARYASCCLRGGDVATPERFTAGLDRLSGTRVFSTEFARAAAATRFPDMQNLDSLLEDRRLRRAIFAPSRDGAAPGSR